MSVKAEAVLSLLCLDVVNDAIAVSPHNEANTAVDGPVHPGVLTLLMRLLARASEPSSKPEYPHVRN